MQYQQIILQRNEAVATIILNRPEKLNALTAIMLEEWRACLEQLKSDESCRIIIVTGNGKSWSAGVDLSAFQETKVEPGFKMWEDGMAIMEILEQGPQVSIAKLNGYCFTGAMEILMAFDLVVAAEEAKIGDTHAKWGIPPKWGMTQRLQHQVGLRKAKELSFTCQAVSGTEAARIGLVNQAVPLDQLDSAVDELCEKIIGNSAQAISAIKDLYHYGSKNNLKEGIQYELDYQATFTDKVEDLKNFRKKI